MSEVKKYTESGRELKSCTITGVMAYRDEFYKSGMYPYITFAEAFRAKYRIPVAELRKFCQMVELFKATNPDVHHIIPNK